MSVVRADLYDVGESASDSASEAASDTEEATSSGSDFEDSSSSDEDSSNSDMDDDDDDATASRRKSSTRAPRVKPTNDVAVVSGEPQGTPVPPCSPTAPTPQKRKKELHALWQGLEGKPLVRRELCGRFESAAAAASTACVGTVPYPH
mgnify:CR=1 FL=1